MISFNEFCAQGRKFAGPASSRNLRGARKEEEMIEEDGELTRNEFPRINLETMSQEALLKYLQQLKREILRVRQTLVEKDVARADAEALFRR